MKLQNKQNYSKDYFAEIIESNISKFTAQSWQWNFFPDFGSLVEVKTKKYLVLGIVTQIQTGSMDPMRYPFAYQKTEEELLAEQPQIFEFLKTTFQVQVVGYLEEKKISHLLPPQPCQIHSFVKNATKEIEIDFFKNADFMHLLFSFSNDIVNLDELLLAILKQLKNKNLLNTKKLNNICKTFSLLTGNDYRRLKLFLKRV